MAHDFVCEDCGVNCYAFDAFHGPALCLGCEWLRSMPPDVAARLRPVLLARGNIGEPRGTDTGGTGAGHTNARVRLCRRREPGDR